MQNSRTSYLGDASDKAYYETMVMEEDRFRPIARSIERYFHVAEKKFHALLAGRERPTAVELGAGSCTLSLLLTSLRPDLKVMAFDISEKRMQTHIAISARAVGGDPERVTFVEGSFNETFPFEDGSIDLLAFDAALHHSRSIWQTLAECRRVLRPDGVLYAQREHFLSPIPFLAKKQIDVILASDEAASAVSENIYTRGQYELYLKASGFPDIEFLYVSDVGRKRWFSPLNGIAFVNGSFLARPGP